MRLLRYLIILLLSLIYEPSIEILLVINLQLLSLAHPYERLTCRVLMIPLLTFVGQRLQELIALSRRVSWLLKIRPLAGGLRRVSGVAKRLSNLTNFSSVCDWRGVIPSSTNLPNFMNWALFLNLKHVSGFVTNNQWRQVTICVLSWRKLLFRSFHSCFYDFGYLDRGIFLIANISALRYMDFLIEVSVLTIRSTWYNVMFTHIRHYICARLLFQIWDWLLDILGVDKLRAIPVFPGLLRRRLICYFLKWLILWDIVRSQFVSVKLSVLVQHLVLVMQLGLHRFVRRC